MSDPVVAMGQQKDSAVRLESQGSQRSIIFHFSSLSLSLSSLFGDEVMVVIGWTTGCVIGLLLWTTHTHTHQHGFGS